MKERVLILGLGQIGVGYDLHLPFETHALSHARAFSQHPSYSLLGGVDPSEEMRLRFSSTYGRPAFATIEEALEAASPSIVVVATPTGNHATAIQKVLSLSKPKAILCEKPISLNPGEASQLLALCERSSCLLFVNYMRRSNTGVNEVKRRISEGTILGPFKGFAWYSKGLYNSGSHLLNLLQYWLGEITKVKPLASGPLLSGADPEPNFMAVFKNGEIYFQSLRSENFFHNTVELVASNGRLRYEQGGMQISWEKVSGSPLFSGYRVLEQEAERIETDFHRIQWQVAEELSKYLRGDSANICTGKDALSTIQHCSTACEDP